MVCAVRAEILQLVFCWASDEIQLQGFGGWSCHLAFITFITSCHFSLKVASWRKLMQSFRFTTPCNTAHCFMASLFIGPSVAIEGLLCTQVCQLHNPGLHRGSISAQQTIKHWRGSVIHHEKQNFSSMQLQFMLGEEKLFLIKP